MGAKSTRATGRRGRALGANAPGRRRRVPRGAAGQAVGAVFQLVPLGSGTEGEHVHLNPRATDTVVEQGDRPGVRPQGAGPPQVDVLHVVAALARVDLDALASPHYALRQRDI